MCDMTGGELECKPARPLLPGAGSRDGVRLGQRACGQGLSLAVSCDSTGHRWRALSQLTADWSMSFDCAQPLVTSWARRAKALTVDRIDEAPRSSRDRYAFGADTSPRRAG